MLDYLRGAIAKTEVLKTWKKSEKGPKSEKRFDDIMLLVLKVEKGVRSQGMW